jgi:tetratricopeptide (TPR) repeat protein
MKLGQTEEAKTCFSNARQAAREKLAEAQTQLRMIVLLHPSDAQAHINLGDLLMDLGQAEEAKTYYSNALRLEPDAVEKYVQEGKLLAAQGNVEAAVARFTAAVRLKEDATEAHANLGLLRARQGRFDEAVAHFNQVLRLRPDAQAHHNLGLALAMQGKPEDSVTHYRQAVHIEPNWPEALNDLAWILATHPQATIRNGPEAVRLARRASQLSGGKVARFWGTLDAAYAEAGRFADAVNTAEKARELSLKAGERDVAQAAERRLILYRKHQPYHEQDQQGRKSPP